VTILVGISGETLSNRVTPPDTYGTGLYRCDDLERADWVRVAGGLPEDPEVRAIAVTGERVLCATQYGVHASTDHGATWRTLTAPRPGYAVWSLAVDPRAPSTILAGYEPGAIYRSDDGGATWRETAFAPTYTPGTEAEPRRVIGLAFDPRDPLRVYAAIEVGGLAISRDGGQSWAGVLLPDRDAADVHAIAVTGAGALACTRVGVLASTDGRTWREVLGEHVRAEGVTASELHGIVDAVSARAFGGNVFAGDVEEVDGSIRFALYARRSSRVDYGDAFDPAALGARRDAEGRYRAGACLHASVGVIAELIAMGARVVTPFARLAGALPDIGTCDCNQSSSRTGAAVLNTVGDHLLTQPYLRAIAVDGDDVIVGAGCGFMSQTAAMYRSRDGGASWQPLVLPVGLASGIFAVARAGARIVGAARDGQVCWSDDDGATWRVRATPAGANPIYALAVV
jgi:photosystem II stability/assembly factor-like uncharacterized protein